MTKYLNIFTENLLIYGKIAAILGFLTIVFGTILNWLTGEVYHILPLYAASVVVYAIFGMLRLLVIGWLVTKRFK